MTGTGDSENEISVAVRGRCGGEIAFRHAHGYLYFWLFKLSGNPIRILST